MSLSIETLSNIAKAELLARIAHRLTVCARYTYEAGTENVVEPQVLRAYNELLHRVTGAISNHLLNERGYSLQTLLEMMDDFGERYGARGLISWAKEPMEGYLSSPENPFVN